MSNTSNSLVLEIVQRINENHPELRAGEMFLLNVKIGGGIFELIEYRSKRQGINAYGLGPEPIEGFCPVFVQKDEFETHVSSLKTATLEKPKPRVHEHPDGHGLVYGRRLMVGEVIEPGDVFNDLTGLWEECSVLYHGMLVEADSQWIIIRPPRP